MKYELTTNTNNYFKMKGSQLAVANPMQSGAQAFSVLATDDEGYNKAISSSALIKNDTAMAKLFANNEKGFLISNVAETERLLLLSNGSTGNTAAESDPVGLILDNSLWGYDVSLTTVIANQTEMLTTAWTPSSGGGTAPVPVESPAGTYTILGDGTNNGRIDHSFTTVAGNTYRLAVTVASATVNISAGTAQGGTQNLGTQTLSIGSRFVYIVATGTTLWIRLQRNAVSSTVVSAMSLKLVPGNHLLQATTTRRLLWKANVGGTSYLQGDGVDDCEISPFIPNATGFTMAIDVEFPAASKIALGGGIVTGNKQASIGLDANGFLSVGWGTAVSQGSVDRRNTRMTVVVAGNASGRDVWVNGSKLAFTAATGAPDGTGGGIAIGAFNNNGTPQDWSAAKIYRALVIDRKLTDAEVLDTVNASFARVNSTPVVYAPVLTNIVLFGQTLTVHSAQKSYSVERAALDPEWLWFEVREGDEWATDAGRVPTRNRAEVHLGNQGLFVNDTEYWFAWEQCIFATAPFIPSGATGSFTNHIIGQWHTVDPAPAGTTSPQMSHELDDNGSYHFRYRGHAEVGHSGDQNTLFSDNNYQYGGIYRYVERVKFSQDGTGIWQVWRRVPGSNVGELIINRTNLVLGYPGDTSPYPKFGYYGTQMQNTIRIGYRLLAAYGTANLSALI